MRTPLLLSLLAAPLLPAQEGPAPWDAMDYGPCLSATVQGFSKDNVALKGRVVFLGDDAGVVFDTELLRVAAAWVGGGLELRGTPFDGSHGPIPRVRGELVTATQKAPGVARNGSFADPRAIPYGPLPDAWGRFLGHYLHGERVVLSYEVSGRRVLEGHRAVAAQDGAARAIERTLELGAGPEVTLVLFDVPGAVVVADATPATPERVAVVMRRTAGDDVGNGAGEAVRTHRFVVESDGSLALALRASGERVELTVPASDAPQRLRVTMACAAGETAPEIAGGGAIEDLSKLTHGGPRRCPETLVTRGELGAENGAFAVDTITVPAENPWHSRLRFGAFDFVDADTAALSTWNGDVWLVDGIDADLDELTWTRFATGLHDPLGLVVVDGTIHTHGRDGIHRLHDLNGDGECDFVEVFNNDVFVTSSFHEFAFDLQTDAEGNFYFSKGGPVRPGGRGFDELAPHHGTIMRVSADGSRLDVVATGLRAPNGIAVTPDGIVTSGDNQGTWMPACRLNISSNGTFFGCLDTAHRDPAPETYDEPICWLPMSVDNSGGGQVWVDSPAWGPLNGELLHQSYGQCAIYLVLRQEHAGSTQGGVVRIPADFDSAQMRGRFHGDGHLYVCGFKGWQTRAAKDTAFQRVRRTAAPLHLPIALAVHAEGIELTFSDALDPETAEDPESYAVEVWNYRWSEAYGSSEYSLRNPDVEVKEGQKNRDPLTVTAATLGADGRTVWLAVDGMTECMQMRIAYDLDAADGALLEGEIHNTVHFLTPRASGRGER